MHIHSLLRAALAACVLATAAAAPATAAPVTAKLRVEAGGKSLDRGYRYATDTATFNTSTTAACGGSGDSKTIEGPSALGALVSGSDYNARLRPVEVSDQFEFGLFVCGIGGRQSGESFWGLRVNHAEAQVGGDQYALEPNDEVLWTFITFDGANSGSELVLELPERNVRAGEPVEVRVLAYDAEGGSAPAAGVAITGGATTDAAGVARLVFDAPGRPVVRGTRGNDIPTEPERLCVWEASESECAAIPHERTVGTGVTDNLAGIAAPELILGRAGDDTVRSRGGGTDTVRCGRGRDTVKADRRDRVARDCERVLRK